MRISDWSSDVCSSDLASAKINGFHFSTVQKINPKENFLSQGLQHLITIFQRGTEVEITVMTGFLAKRDMNVYACHAKKLGISCVIKIAGFARGIKSFRISFCQG